jgi:tetratricopeptide (TPR) repeat protein
VAKPQFLTFTHIQSAATVRIHRQEAILFQEIIMKPADVFYLLSFVLFATLPACSRTNPTPAADSEIPPSCAIALTPHQGQDRLDMEIARLQREARGRTEARHTLERLGWAFVAKARLGNDPGYYKLAEQCALCLESKHAGSAEGLLLRGHALHNLHRFSEAEELARKLVTLRESPFDHGLLGDVLMEQGRLPEATVAYQKMLNLKPSLQSYSRAAHIRWMKGDLPGALQLMRMAAGAGSPGESEATAWVYSRLALYELQAGSASDALRACDTALQFVDDYAPALLARGRVLLADGRSQEAIGPLERAAGLNPSPEYEWALAEAFRTSGRAEDAALVEARILQRGPSEDPRTVALYLATRNVQHQTALTLAQGELLKRADVHSHDVVAWALAAAGRVDEAYMATRRALAEGTQDARIFYHAGIITARAGKKQEARQLLSKAAGIRQMLLPSERDHLAEHFSIPSAH